MLVDTDVAIVGSGFSGLGMALACKKAGRDFLVFEKADALGGTWRENTYPGCGCDVAAPLYSFSFAPNPDWSRLFAPQAEIRAYLERVADDFGVRDRIRFGCEVSRCQFDERTGYWRITVGVEGREVIARFVVFGVGALSRPGMPMIDGMDEFRGRSFHSAQWDHSCDLGGKRVAVIGTGASAIQIVPQIAASAARVDVYQRTPPWVLPKPDRAFDASERERFRRFPLALKLLRWRLYWLMELRAIGFVVNPNVMKLAARWGRRHIESQIVDPELRARVTPDYMPGCKRVLMANDWYPALLRPNVSLITEAVARVTPNGLRTVDGEERDLDVIVYATGFRITDVLGRTEVIGRGGVELGARWRDRQTAYLGAAIPGFPNFFALLGPNTGLGHSSMVFMIEAQIHYVLQCIAALERRGARQLEVKEAAELRFNAWLSPRLARSVWATGCQSWYLDARGENPTSWPGPTFEFWWRTRRVIAAHFKFTA